MTDRGAPERAKRGRRTLGLVVVTALAASVGGAVTARASAPDAVADLRASVERILDGVGWSSAEWGVLAVSLDTGDTLVARRPGEVMVPASNMKLVTTAVALEHLGPDFRYQTLVLADGPVVDGTLRGDLILYGTGDPGLSDRFHATRTAPLERLAEQLLAAGIARVEGDVVGDGSFFGGPLVAEGWDPRDLNDWFAAPVSALSFNENMVTLRVEPAATAGARPTIHTIPADAGVPIHNGATTGRGRIRIERVSPMAPISVEGSLPRGGREAWRQMTVSDPARYAARIFLNVLRERGVDVSGSVRTVSEPERSRVSGKQLWAPRMGAEAPRIVARHTSPPLREYLDVVNQESHNLLAEATLKTLGRILAGDGSFSGGARMVEGFLAHRLGVDTARTAVIDGSGLSGLNRIAPGDFVRLLAYMAESEHWETFWGTLPEAGDPRQLRRMYRTAAAGNLRAKTGTIQGVSALSGLVHSASGERIAFSILGNDLPSTWAAKRRVEDRIGVRLASFERGFEPREQRLAGLLGDAGRGGDPLPGSDPTRVAVAGADTAIGGSRDGARTHRVEPGENLTVIARRYGVTVNALIAANDGVSPRTLQPGAELEVPAADTTAVPPSERTDPKRHQVRPGENFTVIARRYGVSLNELLDANPGISPRSLEAGSWIEIPPSTGHRPEG